MGFSNFIFKPKENLEIMINIDEIILLNDLIQQVAYLLFLIINVLSFNAI